MISEQVLQSTISGLNEITRIDMAVLDVDGNMIASTCDHSGTGPDTVPEESFSNDTEAEGFRENVLRFRDSAADSQEAAGYQLFKVYDEQILRYIVAAKGESEESHTIGKIAAFQVQNLMTAYRERFDRDNFIKNLLLDNLLLVDIYNRSQKLHIPMDDRRVVIVAGVSGEKERNLLDRVRELLADRKNDFVTAVDENNIIVVREVGKEEGYEDVNGTAEKIQRLISKSSAEPVYVAYGTMVGEIREVSRSYKEARMALDVGRIFFPERNIFAYSELGIGRLIYQLPIPLCKMFIKEIFEGRSPDDFDEETIVTINKFFENSLNVSETSRQLFIHRNTLVYRLDKLEKATGLDIRVFEDAITLKIALMVVKYMKSVEDTPFS